MKKSVGILGLGYYGAPLGLALKASGYEVTGSTTGPEKLQKLAALDLTPTLMAYPQIPPAELLQKDILVINIPPFAEQLAWFQNWPWQDSSHIIFISSTSVYEANAGLVFEEDQLNDGHLANQERWFQKNFNNLAILRLGGLLGGSRHPGKSLSGKHDLKSGKSPVNLIHVDDAIGFTEQVIQNHIKNHIFNVVCDEAHSRKEFYQEFCQREGLPLPDFSDDESIGKRISNQKLKYVYQLKWPTVFGTSL